MRLPSISESELVLPLLEGQFEQPMWQTFLARLRKAAEVDLAVLQLGSAAGPAGERLSSGEGPDPSSLPLSAMREGRVYDQSELAELAGDAAIATHHVRVCRVAEPTGIHVWLILLARHELGAVQSRLLTALSPYLRSTMRSFAELEQQRSRSLIGEETLRRMNFGWIALDQNCRMVEHDALAGRMLERSNALRRGRYDRLVLTDAALERKLSQLVRSFAAGRGGAPVAMRLGVDPWTEMLVTQAGPATGTMTVQPVAIAYLRSDRTALADRRRQIADLFQLSPSEAGFALALAQGFNISEAANQLGITLETARHYSKRVYAKTGARGQADLVRYILSGVLALA